MTKKFLLLNALLFIALSQVMISCNQDDDNLSNDWIDAPSPTTVNERTNGGKNAVMVFINPYDTIGALLGQVLTTYLTNQLQVNNLEDLQRNIHESMQKIGLSAPETYSSIELQELINSPESVWNNSISTLEISANAADLLSTFRDTLSNFENEDLESITTDLMNFESAVLQNLNLNQNEKRIILTLSAIIRHSFEYKKGRDDKDWDISVGNFSGALKGAIVNSDSAIALALIVGLNNQIKTL